MAKKIERTTQTKEGFAEIMSFGKGDRRREQDPNHCSREQYEENWDRTFSTKNENI